MKQALVERFSDKIPDQYYYTRLQDAVQRRAEGAEEFSDRCRKMCQRTIRRAHDEETQRVIKEEAERRLLASYIHGLMGVVGQQVQFQMPSTMEQAVRLTVTVENVEKHKQLTEGPRKIFAARKDVECYQCAKTGHYAKECRQDSHPAAVGRSTWNDKGGERRDAPRDQPTTRGSRGRGGTGGQNFRKAPRPWVSTEDTNEVGMQCFHCREHGHRRRDCPRLPRADQRPNRQGSMSRSPVPNPQPTARR
jgi:hypothetical protein